MYTDEQGMKESLEYFNGDELAANVFITKYALRDRDGKLLEKTPDDMHHRIAKEFARIERQKFKKPLTEDEIYEYLKGFKRIIPQGSPMYGIGNNYQYVTLSNCYVLPSPCDSYLGINYLDTQIAQISSRRGGVGWDMSTLRPAKTRVSNAAGSTTGVISFMHRYSNTIREVAQFGRRGASLQSLNVKHPEILNFIKCKNDDTSITGSNISVGFTDDFMNSVINKIEKFTLEWPINRKPAELPQCITDIKTNDIWNSFVENTWSRADPGAIFVDTVRRRSTSAVYPGFEEVAPNPCVIKGTLVNTPDGYRKIEDIKEGDYVCTVLGVEPVEKMEHNTNYQLYKVVFSDGGEQIVTSSHQYHVTRKKSQSKKVENISLKDIEIGDYVRVHPSRFDDNDYYPNYILGLQIGVLLGDGCYTEKQLTKGNIKIASNQDDVEYNKLIKTYVFQDYTFNKDDCSKDSKSMNLILKMSKQKLIKLGLNPNYSYDKDIDITKVNNVGMAIGILDGLLATDGNINLKSNHPQIRWDTSSKKLAQTIRRLLLYVGCHGFISESSSKSGKINGRQIERKHNKFTVTISGCSIANYIQQTKLENIHPEKYKKLIKAQTAFRLTGNSWMSKVKSIEKYGFDDTYDLHCKTSDTWITEGYVQRGCGEQYLPAYGCCRLISINLYTYVKNKFTSEAYFDYQEFNDDVKIMQRLADDMVDLDIECINRIIKKIKSDPEPDHIKKIGLDLWNNIKQHSIEDRRTGCGIVGLGDCLAALNLKYDSDESIKKCDSITNVFKNAAYESSVEMAKELGPFPVYDYELDKQSEFIQELDEVLYNKMKKYGRRNMTLLTVAPTGSVSLLTQTSSGIEPVFMLEYTRRKKINPSETNVKTDFVDKVGDKWTEYKVYHKGFQDWMAVTSKTKVEDSPYYQSTAHEIDYVKKVYLQAAIQKHIDNSISVTTNLPSDITKEKVAELYLLAYKLGCKGFTIYRDGCRSGVLVSESKKDFPKERPRELPCDVHHITSKGQKFFVLVGLCENRPYEIFAGLNNILDATIKTGKIIKRKKNFYKAEFNNGDELSPVTNAMTEVQESISRLCSLLLRNQVDIYNVVSQLEKIGESRSDIQCFSACLARALKKYIPDGTQESGVCPECGEEKMIRQSGCKICSFCGWNACS